MNNTSDTQTTVETFNVQEWRSTEYTRLLREVTRWLEIILTISIMPVLVQGFLDPTSWSGWISLIVLLICIACVRYSMFLIDRRRLQNSSLVVIGVVVGCATFVGLLFDDLIVITAILFLLSIQLANVFFPLKTGRRFVYFLVILGALITVPIFLEYYNPPFSLPNNNFKIFLDLVIFLVALLFGSYVISLSREGTDLAFQRLVEQEKRLHQLAITDVLTGLPNRYLFMDRLENALAYNRRHAQGVAVMLLDLDDFKLINDTLGHEYGDQVLQELAGRLKKCLRACDTVARLGGDEFVIILENIPDLETVSAIANRVVESISEPYLVAEREFAITPSIGICMDAGEESDASSMLKNADIAMYRVKRAGKSGYQFFK